MALNFILGLLGCYLPNPFWIKSLPLDASIANKKSLISVGKSFILHLFFVLVYKPRKLEI